MTVRRQLSVRLDADTVNRFRATIRGLRALGIDATVAGVYENRLTEWSAAQEAMHNGGRPFPPGQPRAGRRAGRARGEVLPISSLIRADVRDRFTYTVAGLQQLAEDDDITIAGTVEELLLQWCAEQEQLYNRGARFGGETGQRLPAGRRLRNTM